MSVKPGGKCVGGSEGRYVKKCWGRFGKVC